MELWLIFLTGLTTGGITCAAMQGGLLASVIAQQKHQEISGGSAKTKALHQTFDRMDWLPVVMFLVAKLLAHIILGFFLGWLGSLFIPNLTVRLLFQFLAGLFMVVIALNLLDVHPFFRRFTLRLPKFSERWVRRSSKSGALFAPALLGVLTIFVPCGVTQAMEVLAINSGNPVQGALILGTFVLGTAPLFALIGVVTARFSESWRHTFLRWAAYLLILMGAYSINGVLVAIDAPITFQKIVRPVTYFFSDERFGQLPTVPVVDGMQQVEILAHNHGYEPRRVVVRSGQPVKLTLRTQDTYSCSVAFTFPAFGISTFLGPTDLQTFEFTPEKPGRYTYSCSMGMYTGVLEVL